MVKTYNSLSMPCEYDVLENFIINNKLKLMEQVVASIEYAINHNLPSVEVFNFKKSEFIVVLEYSTFEYNIDSILRYYIEMELYEFCDRVNKLKQKLNKHEKIKEKRYKSKNSSK